MANWQINALGKNAVEVQSPRIKYIFKAGKTSVSVQAFRDKSLIEENSVTRSGHDLIIVASESSGSRARLKLNATEKRMVTIADINGERFQVDSTPILHGPLLIRELKKRKAPELRHIRLLANELKANRSFRDEIQRHTQFARMLKQPNGTIFNCVVACFLCALQSALSCIVCGLCIEPILDDGTIIT